MKPSVALTLVVLGLFAFRDKARADAYTFTTIDFPGAVVTEPFGLNNAGAIVGGYSTGGALRGFLYTSGVFTPIDFPGSTFTALYGINDVGQVVGTFSTGSGNRGFLRSTVSSLRLRFPAAHTATPLVSMMPPRSLASWLT